MKFQNTKFQNNFKKEEIEDILSFSKLENKKYLYQVLSIKNISSFDASYILNKLTLDENKLEILNLALKKYEKGEKIKQSESYNDFLFRIVRNIEKLEKRNTKLLNEINNCKDNLENLKLFVDFLVAKSASLFSSNFEYSMNKEFVFSKIYIDE